MKASVNFTLRQATIDDAPLFYSVIARTMRDLIIATWGVWDELLVQRESYEDSSSPNAQVIQIGDVSVGVFTVERFPTYIQLEQIYLLPKYQRLGIGTRLLNSLISEASQSQIPVRLRVLAVNSAKMFYEKFGFAVTKATSDFLYMEKSP
ncbi:Acetyltransferase [Hyella patelloides LEGE 07179]|uniref:Acetyltransferase n=1 Tax=Hyella patelloides LEGE 07179 TaxID=945734 RepID=A0A563VLB3_9CYAN|nr:GNAT family N-acetyltransferase [Hyella patelloides]VEP12211.1 Acetyltransferase [Hyella patelloides LEGE 07179]